MGGEGRLSTLSQKMPYAQASPQGELFPRAFLSPSLKNLLNYLSF
jgi:hypothetical protein